MTKKRPGGGVRVSGGKLRVDAARAIDKLRSYQLADPLAWVLEIVRAGVQMPEAESIAVEGSGGDVFVAIACAPPPAELLPRLFEELVDPSDDPRARGLRLLAMGVNSALGRAEGGATTRHVDVYVVDAAGAERVRFTPQLFTVEDETGVARALRTLRTERVAPPPLAPRPKRGLLVHARTVMSLGLVARWAMGEEPRELALVRDAAREVRVPVTVQGLPIPADPSIVMREPLPSGGYVALVAPRVGRVGATLEAAEGGVVLSREPWACGIGDAASLVPLLLRVDRDRLPTNAARSAVRWDEAAAASALEEASAALVTLVRRLADEVGATRDEARRSWLRTIGIALLAADVRGVGFRERLASDTLPAVLAPLLDAKLVYDAVGRPRSLRELAAGPACVHLGSTYAPRELAPWIGDVLSALPGDPTHLLFGDLPPTSAEPLIERAKTAKENLARWLERPIEAPRVKDAERAVVRVSLPKQLSIRGRPSFALDGEVALGTSGQERTIELRIGGRLLEVRRATAGVGIAAVVSCDALSPSLAFDAAIDDEVLRAVLDAIDDAIDESCEALARPFAGTVPDEASEDSGRRAALVRYAILARVARGDVDAAREAVLKKPLGRARVWPTVGGGRASIDELASAGVIGVIEQGKPRPEVLPRARPVLALGDAARTALQLLLPRAHFVDYARVRGPRWDGKQVTQLALARGARVGLVREGEQFASFVAWRDGDAGIEAFHMGERMGFHALRSAGTPILLVVDDERIVPDEAWRPTSVDWIALEEAHEVALAPSRIARAVVRAWLGAPDPSLVHALPLDAHEVVCAVLRQARKPFEEPLTSDERRAIAALPIVRGLVGGRTSADEIRASNDGHLAYVPPDTFGSAQIRGLAIDVMSGTREEAEGLAALVGTRGALDVTNAVKKRLAVQKRELRLATIAAREPEPLELAGPLPATRVVGDGLEGVLRFRPHAALGDTRLLVERRPFASVQLEAAPPHVAATISVEPSLLDDDAERLTDAALTRVRGAIFAAARTLLVAMVSERPGALFGDAAVRALAEALVLAGGGRRRGEVGAMLRALAEPKTLPAAQGTSISIGDALADDALLALSEPLTPIAPDADEAPSLLDRPLPVLPWDVNDSRRTLLERIAGVPVRDVTREARALYAKRRARRGLTARPSLGSGHEPGLARVLETIVRGTEDETIVHDVLGWGVIGLCAARPAKVRFFDAGAVVHEARFDLVPSFEAAVESPLVTLGRPPKRAALEEIERALGRALARLLRTLADERAFDGAPDWALDAQRDAALLGGRTHLERLGPLRLFPTTSGARVSFEEIVAQSERLGPVWWTPEPDATRLPLDPERFALRLSAPHAAALRRAVSLVDATRELELDALARANRARPPVAAVELADAERAAALGTTSEQNGDDELVVAALWPAFASMRELTLYRGRQLLGPTALESAIPVRAHARSTSLTPNRTWSGAERDGACLAIERRVSALAEALVARAITAPHGPFPSIVITEAWMGSVPHPRQRIVRGALTLGALDEDEGNGVRVIDRAARDPDAVEPLPLRATATRRRPAVVPLEGTLVLWGDDRRTAEPTLDAVARHAYVGLLGRLAERVANGTSPDADLDRAQLVRAAELGFVGEKEPRVAVTMPFGRGALSTLRGIARLFESSGTVVALTPEEDAAGDPSEALVRQPAFVTDGSLAAQRLSLALGPRAIGRSDALALALGLRKSASTSSPPKKASVSSPPANPAAKSAKPKPKAKARAASGPVEPLASRTQAVLREVGISTDVSVQSSRSEPSVETTDAVSLAGNNALLSLAAGTALHRERAAVLLAAHVVSVATTDDRALASLTRLLG